MRNYIAIEGTDIVLTEKEWEKKKHIYNTTRIILLGKHRNREEAKDCYYEIEMYPYNNKEEWKQIKRRASK